MKTAVQTPAQPTPVVALNSSTTSQAEAAQAETRTVPAVVLASRSVGTRIEAHRQLGILIGKYDAAAERTDGLRDFKANDDGSGLKLMLVNSNRQTFDITNQQMINRCIELLIETGQQITDGFEQELLNFQV